MAELLRQKRLDTGGSMLESCVGSVFVSGVVSKVVSHEWSVEVSNSLRAEKEHL